MIINRFSISLIVRIALIFANLLVLATIFGRADLFFNQVILVIILVIQVYEILYFISRTNRDLAKFMIAIREADYTATFAGENQGKSFTRLYSSFKDILETIRISKLEKEAQHKYLQTIIDHINIGIISINEKDDIELMNKKSLELLQVPYVRSWQHLKSQNTIFFEKASQLRNEDNQLLEVTAGNNKRQLSVSSTEIVLLGKKYRVLTFKDIKSELDRKEIEAWHKLIRILTHEIMNSVTPMVSLTETMKMLLEEKDGQQKPMSAITDETIEDLRFSLQTIVSRSEGLLHFVEDYRKLTKIPEPETERLNLTEVIRRIIKLMQAELDKKGIAVKFLTDSELSILGDPNLLEQVFINILTNAVHALESTSTPEIQIYCTDHESEGVSVEIKDNGYGIDSDKLDKIFVPFFSTKSNGSGIGLSICQQIMNLHGGFIEVQSVKDEGTTFKLSFLH